MEGTTLAGMGTTFESFRAKLEEMGFFRGVVPGSPEYESRIRMAKAKFDETSQNMVCFQHRNSRISSGYMFGWFVRFRGVVASHCSSQARVFGRWCPCTACLHRNLPLLAPLLQTRRQLKS